MAKIPLGNFGNAIAQPRPRVEYVQGAFDNGGTALAEAGTAVYDYAMKELEARAISEATTQIQGGKLDMDAVLRDLEENPYDEEGKPRFDDAVNQFQTKARERISKGLKESKSNLAKQLIQKDLGNYSTDMTRKVQDLARKQEVDYYRAKGMENLNLAIIAGDEKQVGIVLGGMAKTGIMKAEDAVKENEKALKQIRYGRKSNLIQTAKTKEELYEVRGQLSQFDPQLSPEDNARLYDQVNQRIDRYDMEAEKALRKSQDDTFKDLLNMTLTSQGLNRDVLLFSSDRLSREGLNILAGLIRQQEREGDDDPDVVRRLQIGVLTGAVDEMDLVKIASGVTYSDAPMVRNPDGTYEMDVHQVTKAPISPKTFRQLMADIRTMKDERFQQQERKFDTEDYKAAREYLRLQIPKKATGNGLMDLFVLSNEDSEKLARGLSALYNRAKQGQQDHLKWAQDYSSMVKAKPEEQPKPIPKTPTSGPITDKQGRPVGQPVPNVMQIPPGVQRARDDERVRILRSELAAERANLQMAKTPQERQAAERNIRYIGQELKNLGVTP